MPKDIQKELDEPVTIHFKEDSIPGVRRGVLTDESKAKLEALIAKEVKAARVEELEYIQSQNVAIPCEPECTELRHARHQGAWEQHLEFDKDIEARIMALQEGDKDG